MTDDKRLATTHPALVALWHAFVAEMEGQPFEPALLETTRTLARQKELVAAGASRTMNSQHLLQPDGYSRAIDIGADVKFGTGREIRWDWALYYTMAERMRIASLKTGIDVIWGGVWDRMMSGLVGDVQQEMRWYGERHRANWMAANVGSGKKYPGPLADGPHYELARVVPPAPDWIKHQAMLDAQVAA